MALEGDFGEISQTLKEKLGFCFAKFIKNVLR